MPQHVSAVCPVTQHAYSLISITCPVTVASSVMGRCMQLRLKQLPAG